MPFIWIPLHGSRRHRALGAIVVGLLLCEGVKAGPLPRNPPPPPLWSAEFSSCAAGAPGEECQFADVLSGETVTALLGPADPALVFLVAPESGAAPSDDAPIKDAVAWVPQLLVSIGAARLIVAGITALPLAALLLADPMRRYLVRSGVKDRAKGWLRGRLGAWLYGVRRLVEAKDLNPRDTLTLRALFQRGWTKDQVNALLGRPDYAVLDMQRIREPMRLYDRARVEAMERSAQFRQPAQVPEECGA